MLKSHTNNSNTETIGLLALNYNGHKVLANALYQLVMCRFLECFADTLYIPSGVDCYHAVKPNVPFGLLLL